MDGWNSTFLLGRPIFRGYVSFREGSCHSFFSWPLPRGNQTNHCQSPNNRVTQRSSHTNKWWNARKLLVLGHKVFKGLAHILIRELNLHKTQTVNDIQYDLISLMMLRFIIGNMVLRSLWECVHSMMDFSLRQSFDNFWDSKLLLGCCVLVPKCMESLSLSLADTQGGQEHCEFHTFCHDFFDSKIMIETRSTLK